MGREDVDLAPQVEADAQRPADDHRPVEKEIVSPDHVTRDLERGLVQIGNREVRFAREGKTATQQDEAQGEDGKQRRREPASHERLLMSRIEGTGFRKLGGI